MRCKEPLHAGFVLRSHMQGMVGVLSSRVFSTLLMGFLLLLLLVKLW